MGTPQSPSGRERQRAGVHPDDEFHPPTNDDPFWTETCWFTFTVPERQLSGQLYPFFRPNQGVCSAAAFFWDPSGDAPWNCRYAKQFWHLPIPSQPLSDITLPNGIRYRCVDGLQRYELAYDDPDGDELHVRLQFDAVAPPNYLGESHLDQPGRYTGTIVLHGEEFAVDAYGFRDRSWGPRTQFGLGIQGTDAEHGGYSYATASPDHAWHMITMDFGGTPFPLHGYVVKDGERAQVTGGTRRVVERDPRTQAPLRVEMELVDALGRTTEAVGRTINRLGLFLNPNLYTINCLTEWEFDGIVAHGEDHDNWSAAGIRRFVREHG